MIHPMRADASLLVPLHGYRAVVVDPTGGGDSVGKYLPVGRASHRPVVCVHEHPVTLFPIASSPEAAIALECSGLLGRRDDDDEGLDWQDRLSAVLRCAWLDEKLPVRELLAVDADSPFLLTRATRSALAERDPEGAIALATRALTILPEYGEAWAALASALARVDRAASTAALARALRSPIAFSWFLDRKRLVTQLGRARGDIDDTLFARRAELTGTMRGGDPSDALALEAAARDDLARGQPELALTALMTAGELMWLDTHACRERCGWTEGTHVDRMRTACTGILASRAPLLRS
jgi:hypothetical protein